MKKISGDAFVALLFAGIVLGLLGFTVKEVVDVYYPHPVESGERVVIDQPVKRRVEDMQDGETACVLISVSKEGVPYVWKDSELYDKCWGEVITWKGGVMYGRIDPGDLKKTYKWSGNKFDPDKMIEVRLENGWRVIGRGIGRGR